MIKTSEAVIQQTEKYGANNYLPLPIVIHKAEGIWVEDPEGNRYMDLLSAYSAVNQGHCHPKIVTALKEQAERATLTSRAFHNDQLGPWYEKVCKLTGKEMALPMKDRKSTRLNSSHVAISYAVFCLKKKKRPSGPPDRMTEMT